MKNKILFLGSLCLILAIGLVFIGCETEVPVVDHPDFDEIDIRVSRTGDGAAVQTTPSNTFLVAWTAVDGVEKYEVVFRPVGKTAYILAASGQNIDKYVLNVGKTDFDAEDNTDRDEYSAKISPSTFTVYPASLTSLAGNFGVVVYPVRADRNPVIVWDDVDYKVR